MRTYCMALAGVLLASASLSADSVVGTLTIHGEPTPLRSVAVAKQADPDTPSVSWLVILASDRPVAPEDRALARLAELAAAGKLKAVRVLWHEGLDRAIAAPYAAGLRGSGKLGAEHPTIDLERYDDRRFEGNIKSKMVGQDWFFQAQVKAALRSEGTVELEPEAEEAPAEAEAAPADPKTQMKMQLGKLGYEYNAEMFRHAVSDANVKAVKLFLELGMSPNQPWPADEQPLSFAILNCGDEHEAEALEITRALLGAGAKADAGSKDGITPLLTAAQHCSSVEIVDALIKAGANVNTRAPGGATPLMFAKLFNKTAMEASLRRAGAHD